MQFWEMSFYSDVQLQIRNLYLSHEDSAILNNEQNNQISLGDILPQTSNEKTALEIAAEQVCFYLETNQ